MAEESLSDVAVEIEENEEQKQAFNALKGNEERRLFVMDELRAGKFSDASHIDFLLEQYVKGELPMEGDGDKEKLEQILNGIDGYEGLGNIKISSLIDDHIASVLKKPKMNSMAPTGSAPAEKVSDDLGFEKALEGIRKEEKKNEFDDLILRAQKAAVEIQYNGTKENTALQAELKEARKTVKWYQFKKKRQLNKAIKSVTRPADYWREKEYAYGSEDLIKVYYGIRKALAVNKEKRAKNLIEKIDTVTELQTEYASTRWLSWQAGSKFKAGWRLMRKRSPEKLIKKLRAVATIQELQQYSEKLQQDISNVPESADTTLQRRRIDARRSVLNKISSGLEGASDKKVAERDSIIESMTPRQAKTLPEAAEFTKRLEMAVYTARKSSSQQIQSMPAYQAYLKLHGQAPENFNVEQAITADRIMDEILKTQNLSEEEKAQLKSALLPKKEPAAKKEEQAENTEMQGTADQKTVVGNESGDAKMTLEKRKDSSGCQYSINTNKDKSRYDLVYLDGKGEEKDPSDEAIKAMVDQLAADEIKEVEIEDSFSPDVQQKLMQELEERGITVSNREEVEKPLRETEENKEQENHGAEQTGGENDGQPKVEENTGKEGTPAPEQPQEENSGGKQDKPAEEDPKRMSVEKILANVVMSDQNAEEQIAKIKMIEQIQKGDFAKNGEEYLKFTHAISEKFGKGSPESLHLIELSAAKALENDMKKEHSRKENSEWIKGEKDAANLRTSNQHQAANVLKIRDTVRMLEGNASAEDKGTALNNLNEDERGTVETILAAHEKADTPEEKEAAEKQVIVKYLNAKYQRFANRKPKGQGESKQAGAKVTPRAKNQDRELQ